MCEPATIAIVSASLAAASTISQGYAAKKQGKHAKKVAEYNARVQENEAVQTRAKGVEEENIHREKVARMLSKQRAQLGASGVSLGTGSALDIQEETELLGDVDALRIKKKFQGGATSLEQQAGLTSLEGEAAEAAGKSAFAGSLLSAGGSMLGAGVSSKWFTPESAGIVKTSSNLSSTTRPFVPGVGTF